MAPTDFYLLPKLSIYCVSEAETSIGVGRSGLLKFHPFQVPPEKIPLKDIWISVSFKLPSLPLFFLSPSAVAQSDRSLFQSFLRRSDSPSSPSSSASKNCQLCRSKGKGGKEKEERLPE